MTRIANDGNWGRIVARVEALAAEEPPTKTGKILQLLPRIEASVSAGITLKRLCEELNTEGLAISYRDFRVLLSRVRRRAAAKPPAHTQVEKVEPPPAGSMPQDPVLAGIRAQADKVDREKFVHRNVPDESKLY